MTFKGLSSRAKRGILVFARGGNTSGAGENQDPSLRSGSQTLSEDIFESTTNEKKEGHYE
jgi:hypothetical protein